MVVRLRSTGNSVDCSFSQLDTPGFISTNRLFDYLNKCTIDKCCSSTAGSVIFLGNRRFSLTMVQLTDLMMPPCDKSGTSANHINPV